MDSTTFRFTTVAVTAGAAAIAIASFAEREKVRESLPHTKALQKSQEKAAKKLPPSSMTVALVDGEDQQAKNEDSHYNICLPASWVCGR